MRTWQIVRCLGCGHQWDDDDPDDKECACIDRYGHRTVEVISEGATNLPLRLATGATS